MFGLGIFDAVFGLVLIYILLSLIATAINEAFMTTFGQRGKTLEKAIGIMLNDQKKIILADKFYSHPLIIKLSKGGKYNRPSYISNENFSKVLFDLLSNSIENSSSIEEIKKSTLALQDGETKELLLSILRDSEGSLTAFKNKIETIYEDIMSRASGWYKRRVHYTLFAIGFVLAILFNVDSIALSYKLSKSPKLNTTISSSDKNEIVAYNQFNESDLGGVFLEPGWANGNINKFLNSGFGVIISITGWVLTAFAVSLGAPFWFDMMKKVVNVRGVGFKPGEPEK